MDAGLFSRLQHGRCIGVLCHDVRALCDENLGGVGFLDRIGPGVGPDHHDFGVRVGFTHADGECVQALIGLGDRERRDIADLVGLGHHAGDDALHITALVEPDVAGGHVAGTLVAGDVLELHIREVLRDLQHRVHVTEGGSEDHLVALTGQFADHTFGVRAFRHIFNESRLDLVTEMRLNFLTGKFMGVCPAMVARCRQVQKPDLQRLSDRSAGRHADRCRGERHHLDEFFHGSLPC